MSAEPVKNQQRGALRTMITKGFIVISLASSLLVTTSNYCVAQIVLPKGYKERLARSLGHFTVSQGGSLSQADREEFIESVLSEFNRFVPTSKNRRELVDLGVEASKAELISRVIADIGVDIFVFANRESDTQFAGQVEDALKGSITEKCKGCELIESEVDYGKWRSDKRSRYSICLLLSVSRDMCRARVEFRPPTTSQRPIPVAESTFSADATKVADWFTKVICDICDPEQPFVANPPGVGEFMEGSVVIYYFAMENEAKKIKQEIESGSGTKLLNGKGVDIHASIERRSNKRMSYKKGGTVFHYGKLTLGEEAKLRAVQEYFTEAIARNARFRTEIDLYDSPEGGPKDFNVEIQLP